MLFLSFAGIAQAPHVRVENEADSIPLLTKLYQEGADSAFINDTLFVRHHLCKNVYVWRCKLPEGINGQREAIRNPAFTAPASRPAFLQVRGTVQYDFLYRSYVDTPFAQHDFRQHSVQTALQIIVRDKYPLTLNFSTQQNNSPYFTNLYNLNLRFDPAAYLLKKKQATLEKIEALSLQEPNLNAAKAALRTELEKYNSLRKRLASPDLLQAIVEEKERKYYKAMAEAEMKKTPEPFPEKTPDGAIAANPAGKKLLHDSVTAKTSDTAGAYVRQYGNKAENRKTHLPAGAVKSTREAFDSTGKKFFDSTAVAFDKYSEEVERLKADLDSSRKKMASLQKKADSLQNLANRKAMTVRQRIYAAKNYGQVEKIAVEEGAATERQGNLQKILNNIQSIGIGRSVVNYSELTAWNLPLTGFTVEYNAKKYAAFAVGKIDYGFRDFFGKYSGQQSQNMAIGRIGVGQADRNALIFSAFTGRKFSYGTRANDTVSNYVNVTGYSVEGRFRKDETTWLTVEVAKTTRPVSGSLKENGELKSLSDFKDLTNVGISVKAQTTVKGTGTRLSGFYRKTGENFQSFSLYSYNTDQTAWHLKAEQALLKKKVALTVMLRRNDFLNPFADRTFKTSTVFKTFQATVRIPTYPAVSVGYYPGSQLYVVNKTRLYENVYSIMNASVIHSYKAGGVQMVSALNLNRYANKGTDSGFVAYSGSNYTASQTVMLNRLQLQGLYAFTDQERLKYSTLEGNLDYSVSKAVRLGAGGKQNKVISGAAFWGGQAFFSAQIKTLGRLQVQYEKAYLPTLQKTLFPVESGRISWFKIF